MTNGFDDILSPPESPSADLETTKPLFSPETGFSTPDSPEETLARVRACKAQVDKNYLQMGRDLWRIKTKQWYIDEKRGIDTWTDYLDSINEDPKRAQRLIRVWTCLVQEAGIPMEMLFDIGYSKASLLASLVSGKAGKLLTTANAEQWTSFAREYGYSSVAERIREVKEEALGIDTDAVFTDGSPSNPDETGDSSPANFGEDDPTAAPGEGGSEPAPTVTVESAPKKMTFALFPDQERDIEEALIHCGIEGKSNKRGHQLHLMALGYLAQNMGEKGKKDGRPRYFLNVFEKSFGGRVIWVKDDTQATKIAEKHPDLFDFDDEEDDEHDD